MPPFFAMDPPRNGSLALTHISTSPTHELERDFFRDGKSGIPLHWSPTVALSPSRRAIEFLDHSRETAWTLLRPKMPDTRHLRVPRMTNAPCGRA